MCGENLFLTWHKPAIKGSSPRVRGKLKLCAKRCCQFGLIPACAGKTAMRHRSGASPGAHPRVCGENNERAGHRLPSLGSSPRVRGKLAGMTDKNDRPRLIPACAGKTAVFASEVPDGAGLIPACAGKTAFTPRPPRPLRAHPRVCGENVEDRRRECLLAGSSPRVRGKP